MPTDPVQSLIDALKTRQAPAEGGALAATADLIPARQPTQVPDARSSQLLQRFRQQKEQGMIEIAVVEGLFELVRNLLVLQGLAL